MANNFRDNLKAHFNTGNPLIYIISQEPLYTEEIINEVSKEIDEERTKVFGEKNWSIQKLNINICSNFLFGSWSATFGWTLYPPYEPSEEETDEKVSDGKKVKRVQNGTEVPINAINTLNYFETGTYVAILGNLMFPPDNLEMLQTIITNSQIWKKNGVIFIILLNLL